MNGFLMKVAPFIVLGAMIGCAFHGEVYLPIYFTINLMMKPPNK
jgi:hypothetical protein